MIIFGSSSDTFEIHLFSPLCLNDFVAYELSINFFSGRGNTNYIFKFSSTTITQNTQTQKTHPTNLLLFLKEWESIDLDAVHNSLYPGGKEKYTDLSEMRISGRDSQM